MIPAPGAAGASVAGANASDGVCPNRYGSSAARTACRSARLFEHAFQAPQRPEQVELGWVLAQPLDQRM